jgi:hypothetical protein
MKKLNQKTILVNMVNIKNNIVTIHKGSAFTTSYAIAKEFKIDHRNIIRKIRYIQENHEDFFNRNFIQELNPIALPKGGITLEVYYFLTLNGFSLFPFSRKELNQPNRIFSKAFEELVEQFHVAEKLLRGIEKSQSLLEHAKAFIKVEKERIKNVQETELFEHTNDILYLEYRNRMTKYDRNLPKNDSKRVIESGINKKAIHKELDIYGTVFMN